MNTEKKNEIKSTIWLRRRAGYKSILNNINQLSRTSDSLTKPASENVTQRSLVQVIPAHHVNCFPTKTSLALKKQVLNTKQKPLSQFQLEKNSSLLIGKKKLRKKLEQEEEHKRVVKINETCFLNSHRKYKLAKKVYKNFILNAWRRRRKQVMDLKQNEKQLEIEVQNSNLQITLLINLIQTETLRAAVATSDASHLRARLTSELRTAQQLNDSINTLKAKKVVCDCVKKQLNEELDTLMQKIISVQDRHDEIDNERKIHIDEVNKYREKELQVSTKLSEMEMNLKSKNILLSLLKKKYLDSHEILVRLTSKIQQLENDRASKEKKLHRCNLRMEQMDVALNNIQNTTKIQSLRIKNLSNDVVEKVLKLQTYGNLTENLEHNLVIYKEDKKKITSKCKDVLLSCFKIFLKLFLNQEL